MYGIAITTHNRSEWCENLINSIKELHDPIIVVNDGKPYDWECDKSNVKIIQNEHNLGIPKSKNRGILTLLSDASVKYIFTIEDDMLIKDISVFQRFIAAAEETKIPFFTFPAHAPHVGQPHQRTPVASVQYKEHSIDFFPHMVASFCMFSRDLLLSGGLYDESYGNSWFDVDLIYRLAKAKLIPPFWHFPCIKNIDDYIEMIPESIEKSEAHAQNWNIQQNGQMFARKNGSLNFNRVQLDELKKELKRLYNG